MKYVSAFFAMALAVFFAMPAMAAGTSVLEGHDTEQPIDIVADSLEVNQDEQWAIFQGAVEAVQGDLKFMTNSLKVYYETKDGTDDPSIARLDAEGHIRLESPTESAFGEFAVYDVKARTITIFGGVELRREDSVVTGERLEIDLETGLTKFDGEPYDATTRRAGRVSGRFTLPDTSK